MGVRVGEDTAVASTPIIDSDQHLYETRTVWADHIDPQHRDDALRIEDDELGYPWLTWRDRKLGAADIRLGLRIPLRHHDLAVADHHGAVGGVLEAHHQPGVGLLGVGFQRTGLVGHVGDLDVLRLRMHGDAEGERRAEAEHRGGKQGATGKRGGDGATAGCGMVNAADLGGGALH